MARARTAAAAALLSTQVCHQLLLFALAGEAAARERGVKNGQSCPVKFPDSSETKLGFLFPPGRHCGHALRLSWPLFPEAMKRFQTAYDGEIILSRRSMPVAGNITVRGPDKKAIWALVNNQSEKQDNSCFK